jgi:hypothetical protein
MSKAEAKINNGNLTENNLFAFRLWALIYEQCSICSRMYCFLFHSVLCVQEFI